MRYSIGGCSSLKELRGLQQAQGSSRRSEDHHAGDLVRYNNIRQLPTTMSSLASLRELDLNVGNNFADMISLPRSLGNLEMLEELDISNNQIRVLPESFRMLTKLRVFRAQENPLQVPPRDIAEKGPQAVVQYMNDLVEARNAKSLVVKPKKSWVQMCFFSKSNKKNRAPWRLFKTLLLTRFQVIPLNTIDKSSYVHTTMCKEGERALFETSEEDTQQ
ncbi:hypothetical protein Bca52824_090339 [Brassica carinata]|uniref:Uncharacterized protein n=1 Tax=Brassica carinata TaxID=52824 RepID=A0A8X7TGN0_BRACI|nr:hypothetical protein Bca52824_090339 [Brassica carinata]